MAKKKELRQSSASWCFRCSTAWRSADRTRPGLAVFASRRWNRRCAASVFSVIARAVSGTAWRDRVEKDFGCRAEIVTRDNHAEVVAAIEDDPLRRWLKRRGNGVRVLAVGHSIELFKDVGRPDEVARRYDSDRLQGTHCVGHTRMATESQVSPAHAHPFTAGEDFCLVHNGSLSNPYSLRRLLEEENLEFETDNDSEAACRFLQWRMRKGDTIEQALVRRWRRSTAFTLF